MTWRRSIKRVLYVTPVDISLPNGPGVNEREFSACLRRKFGDDVSFLLPAPSTPLPELDGARILPVTRPDVTSLMTYVRNAREVHRGLTELASEDYDLVIVRLGPLPIGLASLLAKRAPPFVIKTIGPWTVQRRDLVGQLSRMVLPAHEYLMRRLARKSIAIDACTEQLRRIAIETLDVPDSKVFVAENSTNTLRFYPMNRANERAQRGLGGLNPILGLIGGYPERTGAQQMVELGPRLLERFPDLGIVVVGDSPSLETVVARARELGISKHCRFPGLVPYEEAASWVNTFDVGVALDYGDRAKRFGNSFQKVRQYIACGLPVLTTSTGALDVDEAGLGSAVDPTDLDAVGAAAIRWLSLSQPERDAHSDVACKYARAHLSVESVLEHRLETWSKML